MTERTALYRTVYVLLALCLALALPVSSQTFSCCCKDAIASQPSAVPSTQECPLGFNRVSLNAGDIIGNTEQVCNVRCGQSQTTSVCGNNEIELGEECEPGLAIGITCTDVIPFTTGTLACFGVNSSKPCQFDTSQCIPDVEVSCDNPNFKPAPVNVTLNHVKAEKKVVIRFNTVCPATNILLERCQGPQCTDFATIKKGNFERFVDQDPNLKWTESYTYRITPNYGGKQGQQATASITLGDIECWKQTAENTFCISMATYLNPLVRSFLELNGIGAIPASAFSPNVYEHNIREFFGARLNSPFTCNAFNKLKAEPGCGSQACVNDPGKANCINNEPCAVSPFNLFTTLSQCEGSGSSRNYCYFDRSGSVIDECASCDPTMKCNDYKSRGACERDNCGVGGGNCQWRDSIADLGIGVCVNVQEDNCDNCVSPGATAQAAKATNYLFDRCSQSKADALSTKKHKCLFNNDLNTAKSCAKATCADQRASQCGNKIIQLDNQNNIVTKSNDFCGLGVCQLNPVTKHCFKNADGSTTLPIQDCAGLGDECEQDIIPPTTYLVINKQKGVTSSLEFQVFDNVSRNSPQIDITGREEYITHICVQNATTPCDNAKNFNIHVTNNLIVNNLLLQDGALTLFGLQDGTNTIHYYTEDKFHNLEVVKTATFNACKACQGPVVIDLRISGGRLFKDKLFTSDPQPVISVDYNTPAKIVDAKIFDGQQEIPVTPQSNDYRLTQQLFPLQSLDGEVILQFQSENEKSILMDDPFRATIVIDNDPGQLSIEPVGALTTNSVPITIKATKPVLLRDVRIDESVILNKLVATTVSRNVTDNFSQSNDGLLFENAQGPITFGDGVKQVTVQAESVIGPLLTATSKFIVGRANPRIFLAKPAFGAAHSSQPVIEVQTTRPAQCGFRLDGKPFEKKDKDIFEARIPKFTTDSSGIVHTTLLALPDANEHTLHVMCISNNKVAIESFTLVVDTTAPQILNITANPNPVVESAPNGGFVSDVIVQTDDATLCRLSETVNGDLFSLQPHDVANVTAMGNGQISSPTDRTNGHVLPTKHHSQSILLQGVGPHTISVSCRGANGIVNKPLTILAQPAPLSLTSQTPPEVPDFIIPLHILANKNVTCTYRQQLGSETCFFGKKRDKCGNVDDALFARDHEALIDMGAFVNATFVVQCTTYLAETAKINITVVTGTTGNVQLINVSPEGFLDKNNVKSKLTSKIPFKLENVILESDIFFNKFLKFKENTSVFQDYRGKNGDEPFFLEYSKTLRGLHDGQHTVYATGEDFLGRKVFGNGSVHIEADDPKIVMLQPLFGTSATPTIDVILETSRKASCKYRLDGLPPTAQDFSNLLAFSFTTGLRHTATFDLENTNHTLHVACKSLENRPKTVIESFPLSVDTTPPNILRAIASPNPVAEEQAGRGFSTLLIVETDDVTFCRYANQTGTFDDMTLSMSTVPTTKHEREITVQGDKQSFERFVACKNVAGFTSQTKSIAFSTDSSIPLNISLQGGTEVITLNVPINVTTNKNASCSVQQLTCHNTTPLTGLAPFSTFGREHSGRSSVSSVGIHCFGVQCMSNTGEKAQRTITMTVRDAAVSGLEINPKVNQTTNRVTLTVNATQKFILNEVFLREKEFISPYLTVQKLTSIGSQFGVEGPDRKFTARLQMKEGPKSINGTGQDLLGEFLGGSTSFSVLKGDLRIALTKPLFGYTTSDKITLVVETNLESECVFAFNQPAPLITLANFDSSTLPKFNTTNGLVHTRVLFDQHDTTPRPLHVICRSFAQNRAPSQLTSQSFTIVKDLTPPVIDVSASPNPIAQRTVPDKDVYSTTLFVESLPDAQGKNEDPLFCNYDTERRAYDEMRFSFPGSRANPKSVVSTEINVTEDSKTFQFFVSCKNPAGLNSSVEPINITVNTSIPLHIIGLRSPLLTKNRDVTLRVQTNKKTDCRVTKQGEIAEQLGEFGFMHAKQVRLDKGETVLTFDCTTRTGESASAQLTLLFDNTPPTMKKVDSSSGQLDPEISTFPDQLRVSFLGEDKESGVVRYTLRLRECADEQCRNTSHIVKEQQSFRLDGTPIFMTGLPLTSDTKYVFESDALNAVGLFSKNKTSKAVLVDTNSLPRYCRNDHRDSAQGETDKNCGGGICPPCDIGQRCEENSDCGNNVCIKRRATSSSGTCQAPTCDDTFQDGDELGKDCGGSCPPCTVTTCTTNESCGINKTCENGVCYGGSCTLDNDCDSGFICQNDRCVQGCKTSATCPTGLTCSNNECVTLGCRLDKDCQAGESCVDSACKPGGSCDDSRRNGDESDKNCGGSCDKCEDGKNCNTNDDCINANCVLNTCGGFDPGADNDIDSVPNGRDRCPNTPPGAAVDFFGCGIEDKDKDLMSDDWENFYGLNPADPNDASSDLDGDKLAAVDEFLRGSHPTRQDIDDDNKKDPVDKCQRTPQGARTDRTGCTSDSDNDQLPDDWEVEFGLDPHDASDGVTDVDGDGLSNVLEFLKNSNPRDRDTDRDTILDSKDKCPRTPVGQTVDEEGCGLSDTDKDGIPDDWELLNGLDPETPDDANGDLDGDGIPNIVEFMFGLNPNNKDSDNDGVDDAKDKCLNTPSGKNVDVQGCSTEDKDGDGMPDEWEVAFGLNPDDASDAGHDIDGDGLSNLVEFLKGSKPNDADSDNDGVPDGQDKCSRTIPGKANEEGCDPTDSDKDGIPDEWEIAFGLNPEDSDDGTVDSDGDGVVNIVEFARGSNPLRADSDNDGVVDSEDRCPATTVANPDANGCDPSDSDGDGLPDEYEIYYGLDPSDPDDADWDIDRDGLTTLEEFALNTSPTNEDTDGDGISDGDERDDGTDPLDPEDFLVSHKTSTFAIVMTALLFLFILAGGTAYYITKKSKPVPIQPRLVKPYTPLKPRVVKKLNSFISPSKTISPSKKSLQKLKRKHKAIERLRKQSKPGLSGVYKLKEYNPKLEKLKENVKKKRRRKK